ncbi:MAG: D-tyrosyl-tRNA(Tyr) deacylase [Candidatus Thorarchaeota archaeon AB_25]|nr:MAG: D-tyrosyl-tRNA(Tyr) deacylase [Candidatus Thorarchaeota archaeon AB_25]
MQGIVALGMETLRVLVTSEQDIASLNIKDILINDYGFSQTDDTFEGNPIFSRGEHAKLITTNRDMINCDHLESHFDTEAFIFCSRHRAESGKPALLVHSTGNLGGEALFGGAPRQLSVSAPSLVSVALKKLFEERNSAGLDDFDVSLEVTHHGPTSMKTPLVFVELGSSEEYWNHQEGARAVAASVMDCVDEPLSGDAVIGFGGTHYASKFNKLVLERGYKIGHMAPKYTLNDLTVDVLNQMITRSTNPIVSAIIDWKGMNAENKAHVLPMLEVAKIEVIRAKKA